MSVGMTAARQVLELRTPDGVEFALPLASVVSRGAAWLIDTLLVTGASLIMGTSLGLLGLYFSDLAAAAGTLVFFVLQVGYPMAMEWGFRGQTVGKRILGLKVVDALGLRLQFHQVVLRNLMRVIDGLPVGYAVGGCAALVSSRGQRWGDWIAGTVVVRPRRFRVPDLDQLLGARYNSLRDHPHLAARLRQGVSPEEAFLALQALARREDFEPEARLELFAELAGVFRRRVAFPVESTEGMADEQYVRNVVDVLFRNPVSSRRGIRPPGAQIGA